MWKQMLLEKEIVFENMFPIAVPSKFSMDSQNGFPKKKNN
jgi:hypothetical protein